MIIKVIRNFYQDGKNYEAGKSYIVKNITASPRYYEVEEANEPEAPRKRRRAVPRNTAITNKDKR
jgi:hypothetical protein